MQNLTTEQKASAYNSLLHQYQRLQEEVRLIKAKSFEVSGEDQVKINQIEEVMRRLYNDTQKLF
jgi:hypothetical protein